MKKILVLAALLFACFAAFAQDPEDLDAKYAANLLKPGTAAPDFTLGDISGKQVSISSLQGKKVVLVFWASWCPDCRAEVPALKQLQAAHPDVAFVSVSFDRTFDAFKNYVTQNEMGGIQLFDASGKKDSAVSAAYHIQWIPSLYLIGPDGKILLGTVVLDKLAAAL